MMNFINRINVFIGSGLQGKCEENLINSVLFVSLLIIAGSFLFALSGLIALFGERTISGSAALITSLLMLGSLFHVRKTCKYSEVARFNLILVIFILLLLFAADPDDGSVLIWFTLVPVLSITILGQKRGNILSITFLLAMSVFFFLPGNSNILPGNFLHSGLRIAGLYIALQIIMSIFEHFRIARLRIVEIRLLESMNENRIRESFIEKLSHQIRTPLNNIMLVGDMVNKVNLTAEQREMMETIIASAKNLSDTIGNIAEIAEVEIDPGKRPGHHLFDLNNTIYSAVRLFTVQKEPTAEFFISIDEELGKQELEGDSVGLKQVLMNLIETILKNKKPGRIKISILAEASGGISEITETRFEITTDTEIDLATRENQEMLYDKASIDHRNLSYPANPDLSIARKVIKGMGGKLHILPTLDNNRVFLFVLPFKTVSVPLSKEEKIPLPDKAKGASLTPVKLENINVLLVEDNPINQKIVVLSLKKYINNIDVANNGKEALDKFATSRYDIILMDVQMPVIDGFLATRKIREIESTTGSRTPIIAITANALHGDREKCIDSGMDEYISKPFQVEILIDKMKLLLGIN